MVPSFIGMQADIESGTDGAMLVLYDPASGATAADHKDPDAAAESGAILALDTASDGSFHYKLFVDEELPYELRTRIKRTTRNVLLRVPSGRLVASGIEYVGDVTKAETTVDVPPGNYIVDIHDVDYEWDRDIDPVLQRELGATYSREQILGTVAGIMFLGGIVAAVIGLGKWTWEILVGGLASSVLGFACGKLAAPRDFEARKAAIVNRYPLVVVSMRRLPDDADISAYKGQLVNIFD
jgi:hypothetical protein